MTLTDKITLNQYHLCCLHKVFLHALLKVYFVICVFFPDSQVTFFPYQYFSFEISQCMFLVGPMSYWMSPSSFQQVTYSAAHPHQDIGASLSCGPSLFKEENYKVMFTKRSLTLNNNLHLCFSFIFIMKILFNFENSSKSCLFIFLTVPTTSSACCSTVVGEAHIIYLNNSQVKVKVITVANN